MMKVAISGSHGFIGTHLSSYLEGKGYEVLSIARADFAHEDQLKQRLEGVDVVIHLSGYPISRRWTKHALQLIVSSRVQTTQVLVRAINALDRPPPLFISTSGVGIYSDQGVHHEGKLVEGHTFLARICKLWEYEASKVHSSVRRVTLRLGMVLDESGGLIMKLVGIAKKGFIFCMGDTHVPFSWISLSDLLTLYDFIIKHEEITGEVNAVAPASDQFADFNAQLMNTYPEAMTIRVPRCLARNLIGKGYELFEHGARVIPNKLQKAGFTFKVQALQELSSFSHKPYFFR